MAAHPPSLPRRAAIPLRERNLCLGRVLSAEDISSKTRLSVEIGVSGASMSIRLVTC
ncbi:hypothetical protein EYZ11_012918 [Aspergillus tanneri]|uniref:Uncharacterized protein n=1 Tax=Aspergillus tanneri TaxID=1220188 RepID=A0A4S3J148_9EURO|nr:hypothetical protein EYZ11_012918 [Aspergillus tanneri]